MSNRKFEYKSTPRLSREQRREVFVPLFSYVCSELERLSGGDPDLLFALRRKLFKELSYLERGKPTHRKSLKRKKRQEQGNKCVAAIYCDPPYDLPSDDDESELDRENPALGYTVANTRLICRKCHRTLQKDRGFK